MNVSELITRYENGERNFRYADLTNANLAGANLSDANLAHADLSYANLAGAYLAGVDLTDANLSDANLARANLAGADLTGARLSYANLADARLASADLSYANLVGADLSYANLVGADLTNANLANAYLVGANLADADLSDAYLANANLAGTVLDPARFPRRSTDSEIRAAGLRIIGSRVYGWRTVRSQHVGAGDYSAHGTYTAPVFSVDESTPCHPGIYLASREWLRGRYGDEEPIVECWALAHELVHSGDKWRARKIIRDETCRG